MDSSCSVRGAVMHSIVSGDVDKVRELLKNSKFNVNSGGLAPVHLACLMGDLVMTEMLVSEFHADITVRDENGMTTLMHATLAGRNDMVKALLSAYKYPVAARDNMGRTVLHHACERGDVGLVQMLSQKHMLDIISRDNKYYTPLNVAAANGNEDVVVYLIDTFGCDPKVRGFLGRSLLHNACGSGNVRLVLFLLLKYKLDVNARDNLNITPLSLAALNGKENVALLLVNHKEFDCDLNIRGLSGRSVLHDACEGGCVNLVRALMHNHIVDVNIRDSQNDTPLNVAAIYGKAEVVLCLINEFGCDPNTKGYMGRSVLHNVCSGCDDVNLVRCLILEHKADVSAKDDQNITPLNVAAASNKIEIALCLVDEFGCDPNEVGYLGRTLLHAACEWGDIKLVQTLIHKYSSIRQTVGAQDWQNMTPLQVAACTGKGDIALYLISKFSFDLNVRNSLGQSLLHNACEGGDINLVQSLIQEHKADINVRDDIGNTPLNMAAFSGKADITLCLINKFGCDPKTEGSNGKSLLHNACEGGDVGLVQTLIYKHEADISARDNQDYAPLNAAASCGNTKVVLCLIDEFGCDPNAKGTVGRSLLHNACEGGSVNLVRILIHKYNADTNAQDDRNNTPLHIAALAGKVDIARCLINEFGCDLNAKGYLGKSLLHYACNGGNLHLIRTLIHQHKADVNALDDNNDSPLNLAGTTGLADVTLCLINEFGCDPNRTNHLSRTLLHDACEGGNTSLVRTLIQVHKTVVNARDNKNFTPIAIAALAGKIEVALCLINEFGCELNVKSSYGRSLLHSACQGGNVNLVQILIRMHKANVNVRDNDGATPLHVAANAGHVDVVLCLINEFDCDLSVIDNLGRSVLHNACRSGSVHLVQTLIEKHHADVNARDDQGSTPLHTAACAGEGDISLCLIEQFGCDPHIKNNSDRTVLHFACVGGDVSFVRTMINKYKADVNAQSNPHNTTPISEAAINGNSKVVLCLINEFECNPTQRDGTYGASLLHCACIGGDVGLVQTLINTHKADINAKDKQGNTSLDYSAGCGIVEVALCLINEFGCDPNVKGCIGNTLLHSACEGGNVLLVDTLVCKHKVDINARNNNNDTPLNVAARCGKTEVVLHMIDEFSCDPNQRGHSGRSLLHHACINGNIDLVRVLIRNHRADPNARDSKNYTPLHMAAYADNVYIAICLINEFGCDFDDSKGNFSSNLLRVTEENSSSLTDDSVCQSETSFIENTLPKMLNTTDEYPAGDVLQLISKFSSDSHARGKLGRTLLHRTCTRGNTDLLKYLLTFMSPLMVDTEGNTALHVASKCDHVKCVEALLLAKAPILIRNSNGLTPIDVAKGECEQFLQQHMSAHAKEMRIDYEIFLEHAKKKYSGSHPLSHIFVLGDPGAGKSSFIESFKRGETLDYFERISESSVPPHTAGIVPSIHMSNHLGRVLFYDFAGDSEYYSSHAAIFENFSSLKYGKNLFFIVVDLKGDEITIEDSLHYWLSFIQHQNFPDNQSSLIIVGSHSDLVTVEELGGKEDLLQHFCTSVKSTGMKYIAYFLLDCCDPRLHQFADLKEKLALRIKFSDTYTLYNEESLLLGLLEKDFSEVIACSIQTILSHIKDTGVCLPTDATELYPVILSLHGLGILLILGDYSKDDYHVILNCSKLTNDVHKLLFSKSAIKNILKVNRRAQSSFNIGIVPETILQKILPPYITNDCLTSLQYCQKVSSRDVSAFSLTLAPVTSNQDFLFFPALCTAEKCNIRRATHPDLSYSIGWLAYCFDLYDYFPPRFFHVLLLRLVFRFTLSAPQKSAISDYSPFQRRCTMWKSGVHWLMREGVECTVEMVNGSKGLAVIVKTIQDRAENCAAIFYKIISCVMEAKMEFCHCIRPEFFLLDSVDEAEYLNPDNQFAMSDVELALTCSRGNNVVISVSGMRQMERARLHCMRKLTHWDSLFPIEFDAVLQHLQDIVRELYHLGRCLGMSHGILEALEVDFPADSNRRRRELVRRWMSSSLDPPCWWNFVMALKEIGYKVLAQEIEQKHHVHITLQAKLLEESMKSATLDMEFLESFAGVVGSKWVSLAISLSLSEAEIEEVKGEELSQQEQALRMLKMWASREDSTYGQLHLVLKTISLFQLCR